MSTASGTQPGMPSYVQPEVVVVTGASAGVGRAVVREFARQGSSIGLLARGADGLQAAASEVEAAGGHALAIQTDVASAEQVEAAADMIERELGPIDIWINNATVTVFSRVRDLLPQEVERVTSVTYHGLVWGTMAALRRMRARNRGVIVQVGSALSYRAIPLQAAYCAAKHAGRAFTDSLRSELLDEDVAVHLTMVHLPGLNTPQFSWCQSHMAKQPQPIPPIFEPEVAARAIYWAARHRRREIYVAWPTVKAILGSKLAPGLIDRYLGRRGVEAQQGASAVPPIRASNLFSPIPGDHGSRGIFFDEARPRARLPHLGMALGAAGWRVVAALGVLALVVALGALALAAVT